MRANIGHIIFIIGMGINIFFVNQFDFSNDELGIMAIVEYPFADLLFDDMDQLHPPFFILIAKVWYNFGLIFFKTPSPFFMKTLSLFPLVGIYLTQYKLLSSHLSHSLFSLLLTLSPSIFVTFHEIRPYSFWAYFLSTFYLNYFRRGWSKTSIVHLCLAALTHYLTAPFAIGIIVLNKLSKFKTGFLNFILISIVLAYPSYQLIKHSSAHQKDVLSFQLTPSNILWFFNGLMDRIEVMNNLGIFLACLTLSILANKYSNSLIQNLAKIFICTAIALFFVGGDFLEIKFFSPLSSLIPLFIALNWEQTQSKVLLLGLSCYVAILWFMPRSGLLNFEFREQWEEALTTISNDKKIRTLTICLRNNQIVENHFHYYPAFLELDLKVKYLKCNPRQLNYNHSDSDAYMILKGSQLWNKPRERWVLLKQFKRVRIYQTQ